MENNVLLVLLICWFILFAISIFFCFRCFRPLMEVRYDTNVFFFRDAAREYPNINEYTKELIKVCGSEHELHKQLAEQIHAESRIIDGKFKNVKKSITFFGISFSFVIVIALYWVMFV